MTSKKARYALPALVFAVLAFFVPGKEVHASVGLSIQPIKISQTINPGQEISGTILVTNISDQDITVDAGVEDFIPVAGEDNIQYIGRADGMTSARDWITLDVKTPFVFTQGSSTEVSYTIKAPQDAEPGSHFGVIFFKGSVLQGDQQLKVGTRVGMKVLITIPGQHLQKGVIHDFSVPPFHISGPVEFTMKFENTGTVYFEPKGEILIKNMLGNVVGNVPIQGQIVLPTNIKELRFDWPVGSLLFGKYSAVATVRDGDGNVLTSQEVSFWAAPVWYIGIFLISVLVLYIVLRFISRNVDFSVKLKNRQ